MDNSCKTVRSEDLIKQKTLISLPKLVKTSPNTPIKLKDCMYLRIFLGRFTVTFNLIEVCFY